MSELKIKILGSHPLYPNDGCRALCAAVITQAWNDAIKVSSNSFSRTSRHNLKNQARDFLTGNYSREMLKFYCEALNISPNKIISLAMKQSWAKDIEPKYFINGEV